MLGRGSSVPERYSAAEAPPADRHQKGIRSRVVARTILVLLPVPRAQVERGEDGGRLADQRFGQPEPSGPAMPNSPSRNAPGSGAYLLTPAPKACKAQQERRRSRAVVRRPTHPKQRCGASRARPARRSRATAHPGRAGLAVRAGSSAPSRSVCRLGRDRRRHPSSLRRRRRPARCVRCRRQVALQVQGGVVNAGRDEGVVEGAGCPASPLVEASVVSRGFVTDEGDIAPAEGRTPSGPDGRTDDGVARLSNVIPRRHSPLQLIGTTIVPTQYASSGRCDRAAGERM